LHSKIKRLTCFSVNSRIVAQNTAGPAKSFAIDAVYHAQSFFHRDRLDGEQIALKQLKFYL
jgi:hypothetical protein